jgi:hypothetical protein
MPMVILPSPLIVTLQSQVTVPDLQVAGIYEPDRQVGAWRWVC